MNINNLTEEQVKELASYFCPEAEGFEGPETYPDCEECLICICKKSKEGKE